MKAFTTLVCLFLCLGLLQVNSKPAKCRQTTTETPEEPEDEQADEGAQGDDEMAKHITPQCMKTLQANQAKLEAMQNDPTNQERAEEVMRILVKGGCKPLLDYMMKKQAKKRAGACH